MGAVFRNLNNAVTTIVAIVMFSLPLAAAENSKLPRMYGELQEADPALARKIAAEIELEWSKSGSPAMDLLLKRGRDALEAGDSKKAIGLLTALTDHAPDFAEGWHTRAIAYLQAELYGPALADIERTLALNPRHYNAIYGLGRILEELNRPRMAREAYLRALAIHPYHEAVTEALEGLKSVIGSADL